MQERLALSIVGLIDLTTIHIKREEIVHRHRGSVVEVRCHHRLTVQVRFEVAVLHPEEGILRGLATEIIVTRHHWTERHHLHMEGGISLIIVSALLEVVLRDLGRGDVAVVNLQLAVLFLVEDMTVVEQGFHLYLRLFCEHVGTIVGDRVFVDGDVSILCQFEDVSKEVHLLTFGHHGIVEACILVFRKVNLTIDVTTPNYILGHIHCCGEIDLSPQGHARGRGILLLLLLLLNFLLAATLFRLRLGF